MPNIQQIEHITAKSIIKRYSPNKGLGPIDITLSTNNIYSIIGPNASGKTTLIRCLCKIEDLDSGTINYSTDLTKNSHLLTGAVFQQPEPWPHLNVLQNITLPLMKSLGLTKSEAQERALNVLDRFGLSDRINSFSHQLSGGLRQRVVQARTFAMKPRFLFLDEPTSALDPEWTDYFGIIAREYADSGNMVLIVAHQMNFLKKISNRIIYLRNGLLVEEGSPEQIFNTPKDESLIRFLENS